MEKSIYFNFSLSDDSDCNFIKAKGHDKNDVINEKTVFSAFLMTYLSLAVSGPQGSVMINEKCYFS